MRHIVGRFHNAADKLAVEYTASIPFDWRLYRQDIAGSIAHAKMLAKQGIILDKEAEIITEGLASIREEIEEVKFDFKPELEDIHMAIEARLIEKVGQVGGRLHTARSRNDQVALDLRLFTMEAISKTLVRLREFERALIGVAEAIVLQRCSLRRRASRVSQRNMLNRFTVLTARTTAQTARPIWTGKPNVLIK